MKKRCSSDWPEEIIGEDEELRLNTDITVWDEQIDLSNINVSIPKSKQWKLCDDND